MIILYLSLIKKFKTKIDFNFILCKAQLNVGVECFIWRYIDKTYYYYYLWRKGDKNPPEYEDEENEEGTEGGDVVHRLQHDE